MLYLMMLFARFFVMQSGLQTNHKIALRVLGSGEPKTEEESGRPDQHGFFFRHSPPLMCTHF